MRTVFVVLFLFLSISSHADDAPSIQSSFLSSLLSSAQKLGAETLENSACLLRQKALKSVDGMTVSVSADLLKLLPATKLLPASVSAVGEIAAFYRPGSDQIDIQGFLVPSAAVGYQAEAPVRKFPGDINLGLTFGCQGNPSNYEGYFATVGVGPMNLNLGVDLTEMFSYAMAAQSADFTPETVADYETKLRKAKTEGWSARNTLSSKNSTYLNSFRSSFFPGHSLQLKDLAEGSTGSVQKIGVIKHLYDGLISRMERNVGRPNLEENLGILSGVDQFYEESADFLQKTSRATFPLMLQKKDREFTAKLLNPNPRVSGKTFSSVSWRRFYLSDEEIVAERLGSRESALKDALSYFNGGTYLCRGTDRFVTFHLDFQYRVADLRRGHAPQLSRQTEPRVYDCITGRSLSNSGHKPSLDNFSEVRRLVAAHRAALQSAHNGLLGIRGHRLVLNQTYADYRLKSKVEPRKLQIGGYRGGNVLTGCNSVTVSVKDSVSQLGTLMGNAGALYGSVAASAPTSFSQVKSAAQGGLKSLGKVSASLSASHYYPVGPKGQVALKDLPIWFVRVLKGECGDQPELARRAGDRSH